MAEADRDSTVRRRQWMRLPVGGIVEDPYKTLNTPLNLGTTGVFSLTECVKGYRVSKW